MFTLVVALLNYVTRLITPERETRLELVLPLLHLVITLSSPNHHLIITLLSSCYKCLLLIMLHVNLPSYQLILNSPLTRKDEYWWSNQRKTTKSEANQRIKFWRMPIITGPPKLNQNVVLLLYIGYLYLFANVDLSNRHKIRRHWLKLGQLP